MAAVEAGVGGDRQRLLHFFLRRTLKPAGRWYFVKKLLL
jgi:hypothetical protein